MVYDFDLFVIGAGSGGVRAARIAAGHGARVGIAEEYRYGGTCVIRGCVPKKLFVYASHFADDFSDAAGFGWSGFSPTFDWPTLLSNKDAEIDRLNGIYINLLDNAGVERFDTRAVLKGGNTIEVAGKIVKSEKILVATGGRPWRPNIPGIEYAITSNEAFHLESLPKHITVVGGGYIAVEFAGIFRGLGCDVTQLYRGNQILRGFDFDVGDHLATEIKKRGIDLRTKVSVTSIRKSLDNFTINLEDGSEMETALVMYATGRIPNTVDLGLAEAGVEVDSSNAIKVDAWSRTSVGHIYAIGDVTNRIQLTPVAIMEGHCFADTVFGNVCRKANHNDVPSAVFSQPAVGTVGLSEQEARLQHYDVDVYVSKFQPMRHALSGRDEKMLMKLVVDSKTDRVIGCHVVGPDAAEIVQGIGIALKCGATKQQFDATVGIHPTAAEELVTMRDKRLPKEYG